MSGDNYLTGFGSAWERAPITERLRPWEPRYRPRAVPRCCRNRQFDFAVVASNAYAQPDEH